MKTVMKKMFCLLLVAVMLVSAVPAAFADVADTGLIKEVIISGSEVAGGTISATPVFNETIEY